MLLLVLLVLSRPVIIWTSTIIIISAAQRWRERLVVLELLSDVRQDGVDIHVADGYLD
ncbi:hypothetical protein KDW95_03170 [Marinobacterium rhizophilum]|uniref:Secreted protein n=1 Tax=Marinobacterium rhizophilum TaxID=420402 RepID=A0ABY5HNC1_9GAMM|nr:hypothetical protein [Marinobacterium rhizophilum]UTW12695.1 hypothetical protein KDW95_03170 [Marinobacterium rhizophilum]